MCFQVICWIFNRVNYQMSHFGNGKREKRKSVLSAGSIEAQKMRQRLALISTKQAIQEFFCFCSLFFFCFFPFPSFQFLESSGLCFPRQSLYVTYRGPWTGFLIARIDDLRVQSFCVLQFWASASASEDLSSSAISLTPQSVKHMHATI